MRKFTLFDLVQLYRAPHQEGLDLPGARAPHVPPTTDPEQLAAEAAEAAALNGDDDNGLEDIGNADLLAEIIWTGRRKRKRVWSGTKI